MRRIAWVLGLAGGLLLLGMLAIRSQAAPVVPLGRHCGDVGPLPIDDPAFCGCTWGEVLFNGQPMAGAVVTLAFGSGEVARATRLTPLETEPYFDLTAHELGAERGDVFTLTAQFAGQSVARAIRAWPDATGEQQIVLAFVDSGVWEPLVTGGYTRTLALAGETVWAGGSAGVLAVDWVSGISVTHTLPWADPQVRALAVGTDSHIWAAGDQGIAEFGGTAWQTHTVPLIGTPRALAVDGATGAVWVGGGEDSGSVAVYTGTWRAAGTFPAAVMALAVDGAGRAWAATWGAGVYRQNGSGGWTQYREASGLASDWVLSVAAGDGAAWFGTSPYLSGLGPRGGISRYDLATGQWRTYSTTDGLPADLAFPQAVAAVHALDLDERGWAWAGTVDGVRYWVGGQWLPYTTTHGMRGGPVRAIVAGEQTVVVAGPTGLDRLRRDVVPGHAPTAQIVSVAPLTVTWGATLTLSGSGADSDEDGGRIAAWEWASDRDGPLCNAAACALPHAVLTPGRHVLAFRVQDDEGVWSEAVTRTLAVQEVWRAYLPLAIRGR